jgi:tetratricopeptide (TPR) repeat protein
VNVTDLAFSHENDLLAASSSDGSIRIWDPKSISDTLTTTLPITTELNTLLGSSQGVNSVAFNQDDTLLAAGGEDGFVYIWQLDATDLITPTASEKLLGHVEAVNKIAFSPDGMILATASQDHTVELWKVADLEAQPLTLIAHEDEVYGVAFSPKGDLLATSSFDGTVILWEISPDGDFVKVEQAATLMHGNPIFEIAFNADGSLLATAMRDHTIRIWDVSDALSAPDGETSTEKNILWGHEEAVSAVVFHPSKNEIATASWDRSIRLVPEVDWPSVSLEVLGCKQATRNLSLSEWREYLKGSKEGVEYEEICDLPKHPSVADDLIRLGQIYARQGDNEEAKQYFEDANKIDPNLQLDPEAEVRLAQIVFSALKGDIEVALRELEASIEEYPDIEEKANAEVAQILLESARIHLREGDIETAQGNIEQAIELGVALTETDFAQTFSSELFDYAVQYSFEGKFDETVLVIDWAAEINPDSSNDASQILWDLGLEFPDFAQTAILKAIELDPERTDGKADELYNMARGYYNDARVSNNVQSYARASAISSIVIIIDDQLEVATTGELATLYNDICWYGSLYDAASQVLTACDNAVELSPDNGWFFDSRGLARVLTGDYDGAIEDFNIFIESYAGDPDYEGSSSIRQSWINTLELGENPIDEATLVELRNQS